MDDPESPQLPPPPHLVTFGGGGAHRASLLVNGINRTTRCYPKDKSRYIEISSPAPGQD